MAKLKGGTVVYGALSVNDALDVTDVTIRGNLVIKGTTTTVDTTTTTLVDPLIELGGGANGAALTINDGKERGLLLHTFDTANSAAVDGFMGWHTAAGEFVLAKSVTNTGDVLEITNYGNVHAAHFIGNGDTLTNLTGEEVTGTVASANMAAFAGNVVNNAQANITSVGILAGVSVSGTANLATVTASGVVTFSDATEATSTSTGALKVAGGASITANLHVGGNIYGNFAGNIAAKGDNTQVQFNDDGAQNATAGFTFNKASNALTATGTITGGNLSTGGTVTATGLANVGSLEVTTTASVTGNVSGGNLTTAGVVAATGNVSGGNLTTAGDVTTVTVTASGNISTTANLNVTLGAFITGVANAAGGFTTGANIDGTGSSSALNIKNIVATGTANITSTLTAGSLVTGGDATVTGLVTGGNITTAGTADIGDLAISGVVTGNLLPSADITYDLGGEGAAWRDLWLSGSSIRIGTQTISTTTTGNGGINLSNTLSVADIVASNSISAVTVIASGAITGANVTANNLSTTQVVFADGSKLTSASGFTYATETLTAPNLSVTTNANVGGTLGVVGATTLAVLTANATTVTTFTAGASTLDSATITTTLGVTGNTTVGNLSAGATSVGTLAAGVTTITGTASVSDTATVGNLSTAGTVVATGDVSGGSLSTAGDVNVTGTVNTPNVAGATSLTLSTVAGGITLNAFSGVIDASAGTITNLATPVNATDAATKGYVDGAAQGLDIKESVRAATMVNITLSGTQTVDGVLLAAGDRVLVKDQTTASQNGIYVVVDGGSWTRAVDANATGELTAGSFTFVEEGTAQSDSGWVVSTNGTITVGTDPIAWTQFSGAGQLSATHGLALNGGVFSALTDEVTLTVSGGNLAIIAGAILTTPNIGAATGDSLDLGTGNVTAGNVSVTGNITGASLVSATLLTGTLTTAAQPNVTSVGTLTSLAVTGAVTAGSFKSDVYQYADGTPIDFQTASGSEFQLQFHAGNVDGNVVNDLAASANLTFNGNALVVTGTANVSGLLTAGNIVDSSLTAGQVTFAGAGQELTGSVALTFADGTLSTTTVAATTANATTVNATTVNSAYVYANTLTEGSVTFAAAGGKLVDSTNLTFSGTALGVTGTANISGMVTAGNLKTASLTAGSITFATTGGELTDSIGLTFDADGNVLSTVNANLSGYITAANVTARNLSTAGRIVLAGSAGLLVDSANLSYNTGTDTLTAVNVTASGAVSAASVSGNGASLTFLTGSEVQGTVANATLAAQVSGATQSNITLLGTLTSLIVSGATDLGAVGNVTLTGGGAGDYLKTNGAGVLSWGTISSDKISNGTSNVSIPTVNGDVILVSGGNTILTITGTGANVTGTLDVSGNISGNNITAASSISVTDGAAATSAAAGAVTVVGGIAATGNIYAGKSVGFADNNGGTASKAYIQFNSSANSLDFIFN